MTLYVFVLSLFISRMRILAFLFLLFSACCAVQWNLNITRPAGLPSLMDKIPANITLVSYSKEQVLLLKEKMKDLDLGYFGYRDSGDIAAAICAHFIADTIDHCVLRVRIVLQELQLEASKQRLSGFDPSPNRPPDCKNRVWDDCREWPPVEECKDYVPEHGDEWTHYENCMKVTCRSPRTTYVYSALRKSWRMHAPDYTYSNMMNCPSRADAEESVDLDYGELISLERQLAVFLKSAVVITESD